MGEDRTRIVLRWLPLVVVVVAVVAWYSWHRLSRRAIDETPVPAPSHAETPAGDAGPDVPLEDLDELTSGSLEQEWLELTGSPPEWPEDFGSPSDCAEAVARLRSLASRLDERPYVGEWELSRGTFGLLLDASRAMERRLPVIGAQLDDGKTMRSNVAHFFLTLGPGRVAHIAEIAIEEPRLAEPVALALYQWLSAGDRCESGVRPPRASVQYEYAAFLLQTIAGQAYLRRRAPRLEALASFYALLIAQRSIDRGNNPHGLDPRRELSRCKALIEGQPLLFRDAYLRILGEIEERWNRTGFR